MEAAKNPDKTVEIREDPWLNVIRGSAQARRTSQPGQLRGRQLPVVTRGQRLVGDRPDPDPAEPNDRMPDGVEHVPHLTLSTLMQRDFDG
jgi:hypothetical protein